MAECWIKTIGYPESSGELRKVYDEVQSPHGGIDNVYKAQSLLPGSMAGHDLLYKSVLHNSRGILPAWFLEAVAVYTSLLNRCPYAVTHHGANLLHLLGDELRGRECLEALQTGAINAFFSPKEAALLDYARALTQEPQNMSRKHIEKLRLAGACDEEILLVNQVCACFNYTNRVINGLGVNLDGDVIGFYQKTGNP